jgi:radical SAM protein with 4Fe4S-binding SPASM domain
MRTLDEVMELPWDKPFPRAVQIETASRCNAHCDFCPYQETSQLFPAGTMDDGLFYKILDELATFRPQMVAPYLNNEPLLDKKITQRIRAIRNALPDTFIDFSTNASALTPRIADELTSPELGIDEIKLNMPSADPSEYERIMGLRYERTVENTRSFIARAKEKKFPGRYRIIIVGSATPQDERFWQQEGIEVKVYRKLSRGGAIDTGTPAKDHVNGCKYDREKEWMHVLHTGEVVLCCMDWYKEHVLGNLKESTVSHVWNSERYSAIRKRVADSTDKSFICNKCEWGK